MDGYATRKSANYEFKGNFFPFLSPLSLSPVVEEEERASRISEVIKKYKKFLTWPKKRKEQKKMKKVEREKKEKAATGPDKKKENIFHIDWFIRLPSR